MFSKISVTFRATISNPPLNLRVAPFFGVYFQALPIVSHKDHEAAVEQCPCKSKALSAGDFTCKLCLRHRNGPYRGVRWLHWTWFIYCSRFYMEAPPLHSKAQI